jgi:dTDP-4-amino-4,6-dideoxygalactose transaminase
MPLKWQDFVSGRSLEAALGEYLGTSALITNSATAGLVLALSALAAKSPRKTVLVPAYTCPLVAIAVHQAGLKLKLVDTRKDWFDFDLEALKAACDEDTLCIMPTHLGGLAAALDEIGDIARGAGCFVLEDAAQALGASYKGRKVGTAGDIGVYSLTRGKGLTMYEGGAVVSRLDFGLRERGESLPGHVPAELACSLAYKLLYNPVGLNFVYGLPLRHWLKAGDMERAVDEHFDLSVSSFKVSYFRKRVAAAGLCRLDETLASNRQRALKRIAAINSIAGLKALEEPEGCQGSWPFIMVLMPSPQARDRALDKLWTRGLGVTRLFLHDLTGYAYLNEIVPRASVPNAADFASRMLTVSNSHWLEEADFKTIAEELEATCMACT